MKVLLINPPKINRILTNVPAIVDEEEDIGYYPPLGLLYVAAVAEQISGCEVKVLDAVAEKYPYQQLEDKINKENADIVGIQALTYTLVDVLETARVVKKASPRAHVCVGGPHVNIYSEETLAFPEIDSVVLGEGEYIFKDLILAILNSQDLSSVKGILFKKDGKVIQTPARGFIENLDALPFPARHLTSIDKYWSILAESSPITTMISSRGCPYECTFCDRPHMGKKFRFRSANNVVDEIQEAVSLGIKQFIFYDDTFTLNRTRVYEICDEIIRRGLRIGWDVRARVDSVDEDMLKKLKEAGCWGIHFGVESGNQEILNALKKGITLDEARKAFDLAEKAGLKTLGYFMLGNPHENKGQMLETIRFAKELNPDYINVSITTPFPGTQIYSLGLKTGILKYDRWKEFAKNPRKDFIPVFWEECLNTAELTSMLKLAYKIFYRRPSYIIKQFLSIKSFQEFKIKARMGLGLLRL